MKKLLLMASMIGLCQFAHGQGLSTMSRSSVNNVEKTSDIGVGAQVGSLTGVNVDYWATNTRAWTAAVGVEQRNTALSLGHNWMMRDAFSGRGADVAPYIGANLLGVWGKKSDYFSRTESQDFALGAQVPLGVEWLPRAQRFSVFGQIAPGMEITPVAMGFITGDVGARFFF